MKDYLASKLSFDSWKKILRSNITNKAENYIEEILRDYRQEYDRSYAAIRILVETDRVANASQMETVVKQCHQTFAKKFRNKFLEGWYLLYSFRIFFYFFAFFANDLGLCLVFQILT